MGSCELFDDRAFFLFFDLDKLWISKEHRSFIDVLEIHIGPQKRWMYELWTNNLQALAFIHLWRTKKGASTLINEFTNHECTGYSWMYTKLTGISIQVVHVK